MAGKKDTASDATGGGLPAGAMLSGTYEIVRQIGLGGMAEVYRARNVHTDEAVAIKVVLPEFARDQTNLALFKKEATILSRLHHDAIVRYQTFMVEPTMNRPYLVMEFVDGVALSEHIRRAPLSPAQTRTLITRIASGLAVAHAADVIHRDLSPDNIILPEDDVAHAKIVDFGIAKATRIGEGTLLGGKFAGKYNFVSPEQLGLAGGEITAASDIYSLGLIAAAALLGHPIDMSGSQLEVIEKRRTVPDLGAIDAAMRAKVSALLQPLPQDRPGSMAAVIALFEANGSPARADTGTVISDALPYRAPPPAADPWADGAPGQRSLPPQPAAPGSWPADRSQPPHTGSWQQAQPQGSWPPAQREVSQPPGAWPPQDTGPTPRPPAPSGIGTAAQTGASEAPASRTTPPRSESPFGPYEGPSGPPTFGKRTPKPRQKGGGGGGLVLGLLGLLVLAGGGAVFFLQGGFGLLGPAGTPTTPPLPTAAPTTTVAVPTSVPPQATTTTTTSVADVAPPKPVQEQVTAAGGLVDWLRAYTLPECAFAAPVAVAENAMTIEAIGASVAPFEQMAADFQRDNGFDPDVGVRLLDVAQCPVADFLAAVQPHVVAGPEVTLSTDTLPAGGTLEGKLAGTAGWTTDLLLVTFRGAVQNVSVYMTTGPDSSSFVLPPLTPQSTEAVPMVILAISSRGQLASTQLSRAHDARQILPIIARELESSGSEVAVTARYFKLGGAPSATP